MEQGQFEEEFTIGYQYLSPTILLCCVPGGMERDALHLRMNFNEPAGRSYVLHCDTAKPCPDEHGRKHFMMREINK